MSVDHPETFGGAVVKREGGAYDDDVKQLPEKGGKGGICNRTACTTCPAEWYNQYTQRWYCETCAKRINAASTHSICDRG